MTLKWTPKWLKLFVAVALALTLLPGQGRCEGWSVFGLLSEWAQPAVKPVCCPICPFCPEGTCLGAITMPTCPMSPSPTPQAGECPAACPASGGNQEVGNPAECPIHRALSEHKLNLSLNNVPLADCLRALAAFSKNITIVTDYAAIEQAGVRLDRPVALTATDASLECCLAMLLKPFNLTYVVQNEGVTITTAEPCGKQCVMPYAPTPCPSAPDCGSCVPLVKLPMHGQTAQVSGVVYMPLIRPVPVQGLTVFDALRSGHSACVECKGEMPVIQPGLKRIIFTVQQPCPDCCEPAVCHAHPESQAEEMRRISCEQQRSIRELSAAVQELSQEIRSLREEMQTLRAGGISHFKPFSGPNSTQQIRFIYVKPDTTPNVIPPFPRW